MKKENKKKIPPVREGKKWLDYDTIMNSQEPTFEDMLSLINLYPKKTRQIVEKILTTGPNVKQFVKLYNKVRNQELKNKIHEVFRTYVARRSEGHIGSNEDFYTLVDSVLIENNNPFYVDVNVREFIDNILLQWQRSPVSYETLNYLFEILFGGWTLKFYKEMLKKPELYNTCLVFTEKNIRGIFRTASFGVTFPGRTSEVKENLRKYYLVEIFERLVDCVKKIPLQIGYSNYCDELTNKSLEQISLVKKYADMLYTINAISKEVKHERNSTMDSKKKEILINQKKWKKKVTKWVTFFKIQNLLFLNLALKYVSPWLYRNIICRFLYIYLIL